MNAQTVGWLIFLALIKKFSCERQLFDIRGKLEAKEGSCVEIKCAVTSKVDDNGAYWFWMKNATWAAGEYHGTTIYSTDSSKRPVSPDFADRVRYIGSPSSKWMSETSSPLPCSILICDLNKTDSGNYSLRYLGNSVKWFTQKEAILTVQENPCLVVFEKPPVVKENEKITLTCSTSSSCPSSPQIKVNTQVPAKQPSTTNQQKITKITFTADWKDDGKEFSCQTQNNRDKYMIRNISLTVDYAPKDTRDNMSSINVTEGQTVNLTCSIKGRPNPTYKWFKNTEIQSGPYMLELKSINDSMSGEYHCEAQNEHGEMRSHPFIINVIYAPDVKIEMTPPKSAIRQGNEMTLTCDVMRSKPPPSNYTWFKDGRNIASGEKYNVQRIEPENSGNYTCEATNTVGTGKSQPFQIEVEYRPRRTNISIPDHGSVRVNHSLTFTCNTDAKPGPKNYSWYRYSKNKQITQWMSQTTYDKNLRLLSVQRADEACYICNATNSIDTGDNSWPLCIKVLYPPTNITLSMDTEVREGQPITINCTVESFPPSSLTLTKNSKSSAQSSKGDIIKSADNNNAFSHTFNVISTYAGFYTCHAKNREGVQTSTPRELVVKYTPQNVNIKANPDLAVNENTSLTLVCNATSYPPVTSFTLVKIIDGKEAIMNTTQSFTLKSVSPSDSGLYSCNASNEIGSGKSEPVEVKVKYAPKYVHITRDSEVQQSDGLRAVPLTCSSHCYPPVKRYVWYRKMYGDSEDKEVSLDQKYRVLSNKPGVYYCMVENEMGQATSYPYELFLDGVLRKVLIPILVCLPIIITIAVIYRCRRNKSIQQGTSNRWTCFSFLACWNGNRRRNPMSEPGLAGPSRSRDDLLPDQPRRPMAQPCQPRPDTTAAFNINSVYCTVNLPRKEGPSEQKPNRNEGGRADDDNLLNYASLHFGNKQKQSTMEQDTYAMVSKPKPPLKNEQETMEPYENIQHMQSTAHAAKSPDPLYYDSDTSEDELELNYSQVTFSPKLIHESDSTDSSTSDEEYETQYSEVRL